MSTTKDILLNVESKELRCAMLKYGKLHDLVMERKNSRQLSGNIYRGKVTNILQNIQSAFINIGEKENGFIHINDILENSQKFQEMFDLDLEMNSDSPPPKRIQSSKISEHLKIDQPVLVQVVKEPIGTKGARLTSNISIPGRYLVLLPNSFHRGVSRKIQEKPVRERLKKIIRAFELPKSMGLICRTASTNASTKQLIDEAHELLGIWNQIIEDFNKSSQPKCLYEETDLIKRSVLKAIDKKFDRLLVDDFKTFQTCKKLLQKHKDEHPLKIELYRDQTPMFDRFSVEKEIEKAMKRKIWLPSGGYLFFEKTEAMFTIDVNSGRSTSSESLTNVEEALVRINMEAADEIARQLRLRNVGGLIICDFIDMRSRKNQRRVLETLKESMKEDSAKCTILGMSEFGLVEMTRQRSRESLQQTLFTHCPYCAGAGTIKNHESLSIEIERSLKKLFNLHYPTLRLVTHPTLDNYLTGQDKKRYDSLAKKSGSSLEYTTSDELHLNEFQIYSANNEQLIEL